MMSERAAATRAAVAGDADAWRIGPIGLIALLVVWAIPPLIGATQSYILEEGDPTPFLRRLALHLAVWYVWVLATPGILWLIRRAPLRRGVILRRIVPYLALGALILVVQAAIWTVGSPLVSPESTALSTAVLFEQSLLGWLPMTFMVYWTVVFTLQWLDATREDGRRAQEATRLAQAQLQALHMQLHPHFLFNALNTVTVLVREQDTEMAVGLIAELSDVMRHVQRTSTVHEVRLADELSFTHRYLAIEAVRFEDRLRMTWECERDTLDAAVPHLVLQPLVENALYHGIAQNPGGGRLTVGAERRGNRLRLWVYDDGPGFGFALGADAAGAGVVRTSSSHGRGIGLANTRARLQTLYGDSAELRVGDGPNGACAIIELPWRVAAAGGETVSAGLPTGAAIPLADHPWRLV